MAKKSKSGMPMKGKMPMSGNSDAARCKKTEGMMQSMMNQMSKNMGKGMMGQPMMDK